MKTRRKTVFALAVLGLCCLASQAMAASQLITLTYGAASAARMPQSPSLGELRLQRILGPGAARSIRGILEPQCNDCYASGTGPLSEQDVKITLITNAPGCGVPSISNTGFSFSIEWPSSCLDFGESVTICVTTSKTPIDVQSANVYDSEDEQIGKASSTVGPEQPSCSPLDCSGAAAQFELIWPPNHKLAPVTITGVVGATSIAVTGITQDEPVNSRADGNTCPDATIVDGAANVRMERAGTGNGRVYAISFTATNGTDNCSGVVHVCVPHDQAGDPCVDDGQNYDSAAPCSGGRGHIASEPIDTEAVRSSLRGSNASIEYSVPARGRVTLNVYDVSGRRVASLLDDVQEAGPHNLSWSVSSLPNGFYFYRLRANGVSMTRSLLIAR